jgi:hypothetical protein
LIRPLSQSRALDHHARPIFLLKIRWKEKMPQHKYRDEADWRAITLQAGLTTTTKCPADVSVFLYRHHERAQGCTAFHRCDGSNGPNHAVR